MRIRFIAGTCAVLAIATTLVAMAARRRESPAKPTPSTPLAPTRAIQDGSSQARSVPPRVRVPKSGASPTPATNPRPLPSWIDGTPRSHQELAEHWKAEPRDSEWSEDVRGYLTAMLEAVDAAVDPVRAVDCRQTLCRIELDATAALLQLSEAAASAHFRFVPAVAGEGEARVLVLFAPRQELADRVLGPETEE
jgi:hypothetical protein